MKHGETIHRWVNYGYFHHKNESWDASRDRMMSSMSVLGSKRDGKNDALSTSMLNVLLLIAIKQGRYSLPLSPLSPHGLKMTDPRFGMVPLWCHQTWLARKSAWRWALKWENLGLESNGLLLNPIKTH